MEHIAENYFTNHPECSEMIIAFSGKSTPPKSVYFQKKKLIEARKFYIRAFIITLIINIIFIIAAFSQLMTNKNASITITAGSQVSVKGTIQNEAGATIANAGTIDLTGNWINNSGNTVFGASAGTVILNGGAQAIGGANSTTFNNLSLKGTGTKTLSVNTTAGGAAGNGVLDVSDQVLDLNSKSLSMNNPSASGINYSTGMILSEDIDNSSIVQWNIGATIGNHVIPFGNNSGVSIPLGINLTGGNIGNVTASTYPTAPDNTPYPVTPVLVTHMRSLSGNDNSANTVDRFWEIDKTGASGTASITFAYANSEIAANGNTNVRAQRWNAPAIGWDAALPGQVNPVANTVIVPLVNNYGAWALSLEESPLPIEMVQFDARVVNNKYVSISWITEAELNNDFFTVLRSKDGMHFEHLAKVDGAGNTTEEHRYALNDEHPYDGVSYYRLLQTDFNGAQHYFEMKSVLITTKKNLFEVYPNPFINEITVLNTIADEHAEIIISDAIGNVVFKAAGVSDKIQKFDLSGLNAGVYFATLKTSAGAQSIRLIKTK